MACGPAEPQGPPDIVVVLVNGLRAGVPGADAALVEQAGLEGGWRFERAYAQTPRASLGIASILTGLYPSAIPICQSGAGDAPARCGEVPASRPLIQEILGAYGYRSAAFEESYAGRQGLRAQLAIEGPVVPERGFDHRELLATGGPDRLQSVRSWWAQDASRPRFLLYSEELASDALGAACSTIPHAATPPDPALAAGVERAYVAAASEAGSFVGHLREALPPGPRPRWLVVTSLYGTNLGETTGVQDGQLRCASHEHLLERELHVPLVIEGAPASPRREEIVQLIDLLPTLAVAAGAVLPAEHHGQDLLGPPLGEDAAAYAEYGDMLALHAAGDLLTVRCFDHGSSSLSPRLTRLVSEDFHQLGQPRPQLFCTHTLYDVARDPLQQDDLLASGARPYPVDLLQRLVGLRQGAASPRLPDGLSGEEQRIGYW